jgi:hypothetical protein
MDTNKTYNKMQSEDLSDLNLDRLYSAWKDDRQSAAPMTLREWTARYPVYGAELTQWASAAPVVECEEDLSGAQIERTEQRAREIGLNVIAARRARYSVAPVALSDIYGTARARGLDPRTLAANLGVGLPIVAKLQQRLIRFSTIPAALIERLSIELQVTVQQVSDYLRQPASLAAGASYKSNGVPQAAAQEDFSAALRSCPGMTADQKQRWLSEVTDAAGQP